MIYIYIFEFLITYKFKHRVNMRILHLRPGTLNITYRYNPFIYGSVGSTGLFFLPQDNVNRVFLWPVGCFDVHFFLKYVPIYATFYTICIGKAINKKLSGCYVVWTKYTHIQIVNKNFQIVLSLGENEYHSDGEWKHL